ncbi:unnamed protein product [Aphanomyces euteiches]|uniref:Xylose isomerase n=1 Tax=Aphanomyces euteiches TaxID=100861 RepID=A0A6G0XA40_9STRA|nr:hypothetical protein Ae201684_006797 [Aphanomyces euteiches]KAH9087358.1 hypothetical protein Ae201684P_000769 [Aphanomyces euteiches]
MAPPTQREFFADIPAIRYVSPETATDDLLVYREYNADEVILGRPMHEWLRFAVCFWHTFLTPPSDVFGEATTIRPWNTHEDAFQRAKERVDAGFEFISKLGVKYYTFHDTDILPDGLEHHWPEMTEYLLAKQQATGIKLLWGTVNMFNNKMYMHGAATSPHLPAFLSAAEQVQRAMEITHKLGGENFVLWGGREGFQTILNTDIGREEAHYAAFLRMAVAYKAKIGATFQFLIEPKPHEPMKHQYDYDAATTLGFLYRHGLQDHFKLNIEPNHTTLAGHDYVHDIVFASTAGHLGSIDANSGDPSLGWDTDQFPMDSKQAALIMRAVIKQGGLAPGGLNFDAKVRRESTALRDIVMGHIGAIDNLARGLRKAAEFTEKLDSRVNARYATWESDVGRLIEKGGAAFDTLPRVNKATDFPPSGEQEAFEVELYRALH